MRQNLFAIALGVLVPIGAGAQQAGSQQQIGPSPQTAPKQQPGPPFSFGAPADEEAEGPMTPARMADILRRIDPQAQSQANVWRLTVVETAVIVVYDQAADRMRALSPVRPAEGIAAEEMIRMMQANFDSALDARYAIANGMLWAAFIHPLSSLSADQLVTGIGQVVNLRQSYGTLYSSGMLQYQGGDSEALQRRLIDDLRARAGTDI